MSAGALILGSRPFSPPAYSTGRGGPCRQFLPAGRPLRRHYWAGQWPLHRVQPRFLTIVLWKTSGIFQISATFTPGFIVPVAAHLSLGRPQTGLVPGSPPPFTGPARTLVGPTPSELRLSTSIGSATLVSNVQPASYCLAGERDVSFKVGPVTIQDPPGLNRDVALRISLLWWVPRFSDR
jgi:hypothetical protein